MDFKIFINSHFLPFRLSDNGYPVVSVNVIKSLFQGRIKKKRNIDNCTYIHGIFLKCNEEK